MLQFRQLVPYLTVTSVLFLITMKSIIGCQPSPSLLYSQRCIHMIYKLPLIHSFGIHLFTRTELHLSPGDLRDFFFVAYLRFLPTIPSLKNSHLIFSCSDSRISVLQRTEKTSLVHFLHHPFQKITLEEHDPNSPR